MAIDEPYSTLELGAPMPQGQVPFAEEDHPPGYFDHVPSAPSRSLSPSPIQQENPHAKGDFSEDAAPPSSLPNVDFSKYAIAGTKLSNDQTTQTIYSSLLTSDAHELDLFIQGLTPLPPLLEINIVGKMKDKVMFDIKCNMMGLIHRNQPPAFSYVQVLEEGENGYRGGSEPSTVPHPVHRGGDGWCRQFCEDSAPHKSFTFKREVHNWNTEALESRIRTLITATKFTGSTEVSFPLAYSRITVHTPNPPKTPGRVQSIFSSGKKNSVDKYEVIKTIWPYAIKRDGVKTYAVQSEDSWWTEWNDAIRYAVLTKRRGWVTAEDRMDVAMNPTSAEGIFKEKD